MNARHVPVFIGLLALLIVAGTSMFTVSATQYAIRKEFGAIVGTRYEPGLHFKWPWDTVTKFDSRILSQSYTGETFLTNDGRGLIVDFYIKWKVKDPSLFFTTTGGDEGIAGEGSPRSSRTASRPSSRSARCSRSSPASALR